VLRTKRLNQRTSFIVGGGMELCLTQWFDG
jgi:hypothetical protein